ncbi:MAG: PIN domain-containing protein [Chloroflexi bacterium]|nr:PIN domain-containing protein [Chloroflexota bacterium]MBP7044015.1 PIN domain-containing protein [Chloroflexota bacterium]
MRIYLDTCSLQRPLDSKSQIRILLEADAILGIIALCEANSLELISSAVLLFEAENNPNRMRRIYAFELLAKARVFVDLQQQIETRAAYFNAQGIKPLDALHLASAEEANADYFCTCDNQFLKRAQAISELKTKVVSPLELVKEIEP